MPRPVSDVTRIRKSRINIKAKRTRLIVLFRLSLMSLEIATNAHIKKKLNVIKMNSEIVPYPPSSVHRFIASSVEVMERN